MRPIYLICGVSGAGKTWVCEKLTHKFQYVPHDDYIKTAVMHKNALANFATHEGKPLITDIPFGERPLKEFLESKGITVKPVFIIEPTEIVAGRYLKREGKPLPLPARTRSKTILDRANEWKAPFGTAQQILDYLKEVNIT